MTPEQHREAARKHCRKAAMHCLLWACGPHEEREKIDKIINDLARALVGIKELTPKEDAKETKSNE